MGGDGCLGNLFGRNSGDPIVRAFRGTISRYHVLCRVPVSLAAAGSALTGALLSPSRSALLPAVLTLGVFLLACGASALNQVQEQDLDARMDRTRSRPLPSGTMSVRHALATSILLLLVGLVFVSAGGIVPAALGAAAIVWYNGVYTLLKRRSPFAALTGACTGAIPPIMGWTAGGGSFMDPKIFAVAALFFLWQIPHVSLHQLSSDDLTKAGLPSLSGVIPRDRLVLHALLWTATTAIAVLSLPLLRITTTPAAGIGLLALALWLTAKGMVIFRLRADAAVFPSAFRRINIFIALVMALVCLESILGRS